MKDDKLVRFFNAINFNKDYLKYYENASLKEVLLRRKENRMTMIINIDSLPPIEVFKETYEKGKTLEGAKEVRFKFIVENNTLLFKEYFDYYFDILISKCPMLNCIDRNKITFNNNKINIEVLNPAEYNKIEEIKEKIEIFMSDMGFDDVEVKSINLSSFNTRNVTDMRSMFMSSKSTIGYAKTQTDADKFNSTSYKPSGLNFIVK